jgi:class 3 adenylate cyclase
MNIIAKGVWMLTLSESLNKNKKTYHIETVQLLSKIKKNIENELINCNNSSEITDIYNDLKNTISSYIPNNPKNDKSHNDNNDGEFKLYRNLLENILPLNFAEKYIYNNKDIKKYDNLVILMTDIVGYSSISIKNNNEYIFYILNEMYERFDKIISKYDELQKIETIGDAYMLVGDLNNKYSICQVIEKIIEVGYLFIKEIKLINTYHIIDELQIRIGISMGPVMVGILGRKVPRLSVVGHAVNLAARLQSSTKPDCICLSNEIYNNINNKEKYDFDVNEIELKNIGKTANFTIHVKTNIDIKNIIHNINDK